MHWSEPHFLLQNEDIPAASCNIHFLSWSGLHLEIDPGGIYEKGGGGAKPCVDMHKHMYTRGVWGHAPPGNFSFRLTETASGAFSGTL